MAKKEKKVNAPVENISKEKLDSDIRCAGCPVCVEAFEDRKECAAKHDCKCHLRA